MASVTLTWPLLPISKQVSHFEKSSILPTSNSHFSSRAICPGFLIELPKLIRPVCLQQHQVPTSYRPPTMKPRQATNQTDPLTLQDLPPEIHLKLFDIMDLSTSVCFGLTCKQFYATHWKKHGRVELYHTGDRPLLYHIHRSPDWPLWVLIQNWMGPDYTNMQDGCPIFRKTVGWLKLVLMGGVFGVLS